MTLGREDCGNVTWEGKMWGRLGMWQVSPLLAYTLQSNSQFGHQFSASHNFSTTQRQDVTWSNNTIQPLNFCFSKWAIWTAQVLVKMLISGSNLRPIKSELGEWGLRVLSLKTPQVILVYSEASDLLPRSQGLENSHSSLFPRPSSGSMRGLTCAPYHIFGVWAWGKSQACPEDTESEASRKTSAIGC